MLTIRDNRRARSKSPGGRDRDRSHSRDTRAKSPPRAEHKKKTIKISISDSESESEEDDRRTRDKKSSKKYYDSESDDDRRRQKKTSKKYEESESSESDRHKKKSTSKKYYDSDSDDRKRSKKESKPSRRRDDSDSESDRRREKSKKSSKKRHDSESSSSSEGSPKHRHSHAPTKSKHHEDERQQDRYVGYAQPPQYAYAQPPSYGPDQRGNYHDTRHMSYVETRPPPDTGHTDIPDPHRVHSISNMSGQGYAPASRYEYAQPDPSLAYRAVPERKESTSTHRPTKKDDANLVYQTAKGGAEYVKTYGPDGKAQLVEIKPESKADKRVDRRASPPEQISSRMSHLGLGSTLGAGALGVAAFGVHDGGRPPASPLLEAYHGTYQSISPMPSPMMLASKKEDSDLSDLELSDSDSDHKRKMQSRHRESDASITVFSPSASRKRVSFYDPTEDAKRIAAALAGTRHPANPKPLIQILPALSTEDILALRTEYKNHAKVAGQGINIAKHIKMRVPGNLGKAAYATALGRWESEAYWANSWYQGGASRRELLIESLIGRTNSDIREIKNCFKDKRYGDDLEKCIKAELKADKFRSAILLALEERRMSDSAPLDIELIQQDVVNLYKVLSSREGGETAMIQIIVLRSDAHLKEMMRWFEKTYHRNFAREMIGKSRNLVVSLPATHYVLSTDTSRRVKHLLISSMEPSIDQCVMHSF